MIEKEYKKKKLITLKEDWIRYLKDSKLSTWEIERRATWNTFHKYKVPKD